MGSERLRAIGRAALLVVAGAVAASAWARGLPATALVALLVAGWTAALTLADTPRDASTPPAAPLIASDGAEERRLRAYLDLSPAPLIALRGAGVRTINRAARRLFAAAELVAQPPPALVEALSATSPGRTATVRLVEAGRERGFALVTADLALGGGVTRIGALLDIDAELEAAEAAALRDLVRVLSHEIVNALTPIASLARTAAEMLAEPDPPLADVRDAAETVARRAEGLRRFGDGYRALARLPEPVRTIVPVASLLADLERLFATRWPAIAFRLNASDAPPTVDADPDQLSAALWALLQNAAEALQGRARPVVALRVSAMEGATLFDVVDNGPGLPPDERERVFQPFVTTKPDGSGVGLPLARQIVRAHGGQLTAEPGATGAWFRVRLPSA